MTRSLVFSLSALTLSLTAAQPVRADITAAELWAEWQSTGQSMGQTISVDQTIQSDTGLTLQGYSATFDDPEVSVVTRLDTLTMTENEDGTVTVEPSEAYEITLSFPDGPGGRPINIGMTLLSDDLVVTASGTPDAILYEYSATALTLEDGPITGGDGNPPTIDAQIVLHDFNGDYRIDSTDPDNIAYDSAADFSGLSGAITILPPVGEEGRMKISLAMGATVLDGAGSLGNLATLASAPDTVPAGFDLRTDYSYERIIFEMNFDHPDDGFALFYANEGGAISAAISDTALDYTLSAQGAQARVSAQDLPFPISASVGSAAMSVQVPLAPGDGPSPMSARLAYEDVILGPQIWNLVDPGGAIPRDPLTVIVDLSGMVQLFTSIMAVDPSRMDAPPGELRQLSLNELRLEAGGAALTGTGTASFAPGQFVPEPVGSVDLQLSGGNALLAAAQAAGIAEPQQLAMVRGMLAAFARPGAMPDTLETTITFTENGIIANGVPLR